MIRPRFSPEFNIGHLFQAAVVVLMMAPGYLNLVRSQAQLEAEQKAIIAAQVAASAAESLRITNDEHRIDLDEASYQHRLDQINADFEAFEGDMRGQLSKVLDAIGAFGVIERQWEDKRR